MKGDGGDRKLLIVDTDGESRERMTRYFEGAGYGKWSIKTVWGVGYKFETVE